MKDKLREGDIVFTTSNTPIGAIIRGVTKSPVNHIGILVRKVGSPELYIAEMVGKGLVYSELSKYDSKWRFWDGVTAIKYSPSVYISYANQLLIRNWVDYLVNDIGVNYDYQELLSFLFDKDDDNSKDMVCSKLVFNLLLITHSPTDYRYYKNFKSGMHLNSLLVSPGDIYKDSNLYDALKRR